VSQTDDTLRRVPFLLVDDFVLGRLPERVIKGAVEVARASDVVGGQAAGDRLRHGRSKQWITEGRLRFLAIPTASGNTPE
jgi:hypothetical protein